MSLQTGGDVTSTDSAIPNEYVFAEHSPPRARETVLSQSSTDHSPLLSPVANAGAMLFASTSDKRSSDKMLALATLAARGRGTSDPIARTEELNIYLRHTLNRPHAHTSTSNTSESTLESAAAETASVLSDGTRTLKTVRENVLNKLVPNAKGRKDVIGSQGPGLGGANGSSRRAGMARQSMAMAANSERDDALRLESENAGVGSEGERIDDTNTAPERGKKRPRAEITVPFGTDLRMTPGLTRPVGVTAESLDTTHFPPVFSGEYRTTSVTEQRILQQGPIVAMGLPPTQLAVQDAGRSLQQLKSGTTELTTAPTQIEDICRLDQNEELFALYRGVQRLRRTHQSEVPSPATAQIQGVLSATHMPGGASESLGLPTNVLGESDAPLDARKGQQGIQDGNQLADTVLKQAYICFIAKTYNDVFSRDRLETDMSLPQPVRDAIIAEATKTCPAVLDTIRRMETAAADYNKNKGKVSPKSGGIPGAGSAVNDGAGHQTTAATQTSSSSSSSSTSSSAAASSDPKSFAFQSRKSAVEAQQQISFASSVFHKHLAERERVMTANHEMSYASRMDPVTAMKDTEPAAVSVPVLSVPQLAETMKQPLAYAHASDKVVMPLCCNGDQCIMKLHAATFRGAVRTSARAPQSILVGDEAVLTQFGHSGVASMPIAWDRTQYNPLQHRPIPNVLAHGFIGAAFLTSSERQSLLLRHRTPDEFSQRTCSLCHIAAYQQHFLKMQNSNSSVGANTHTPFSNYFEVIRSEWPPEMLLPVPRHNGDNRRGFMPQFSGARLSYQVVKEGPEGAKYDIQRIVYTEVPGFDISSAQ